MTDSKALNHKIWYLAWPMIISNLSVPLVGLVDTAILGHLDSALYIGAVAVSSSILAFLYWGFGFLRMGTTGLSAQAFGAQDNHSSRLIIGQSLLLALALGLLVLALSPWLIPLGLSLVRAPVGAEQLAASYAHIRIVSAPAVLINYAIIGWFIGRQNTRVPLLLTLLTSIINLILDIVLVLGLGLNSDGAAIATLIAELTSACVAVMLVRRELGRTPARTLWRDLFNWQDYQRLLQANAHLFVRTLVLLASMAFFTAQGAAQGGAILAANAILMNFLLLTSFGLDGIAHAAEALVGDAVGQRDRSLFTTTCRSCSYWSLLIALLFSLLFVLAGAQLISLLTSLTEVQAQARQFLPWMYLLPLVAVWSYLLDGIFIGATKTKAMQISMLISALLVYLPCWLVSQHWGNHGLWFAFVAFNAARGITLGWYFFGYNRDWRWWEN